MFTLNPTYYNSVLVVPKVMIEKYIKMASFCAVKTLLWILNNQGGNFSVEEIAKAIGSSPADTKEALDYWINEGILLNSDTDSNSAPSPTRSDSYLKKEPESKPEPSLPLQNIKSEIPEIKLIRPTSAQVSNRIDTDSTFSGLLNHIQVILGRPIGYDMQSSVLMMYDSYGLDVEVICTLIQFCKNQGKSANAYILSMAKLWYEKDITTLEKANEYIDMNNRVMKIYTEFCQLTGIDVPKPTPKQTEMFGEWDKMGFSVEMMVLAYNETVERKGKVQFGYTNKILLSWFEKGYKTPADIQAGKESYKKQQEKLNSGNRSYDINKAIEQATSGDLIYKKRKKAE